MSEMNYMSADKVRELMVAARNHETNKYLDVLLDPENGIIVLEAGKGQGKCTVDFSRHIPNCTEVPIEVINKLEFLKYGVVYHTDYDQRDGKYTCKYKLDITWEFK